MVPLLLAAGCARVDPAPEVFPFSIRDVPERALSRVRVLLREELESALVENSTLGERLAVLARPGQIVLLEPEGRLLLGHGSGFRFDPRPGRLLRLDGVAVRGALEAFVNPLRRAVLVNELPLEEYLRGVVPGELGPDAFPEPAALEAQSVAARTYSVASLGRFAVRGFDLYGDERSQVYAATAAEHPLSDRAVNRTRGVVALFDGEPITAFYSSTCGGVTAAYADVFSGEPLDYLPGGVICPDEESPYRRWSVTLQPERIAAGLAEHARVGRLRDLEVLERDFTGRVTAMRFAGEQGSRVLGGLALRRALGLRSHFIESLQLERDGQGWVRRIAVEGRGFGHGVGLCQIGAVAWARRGKTFEEILTAYYPGVSVEPLYGP